MTITTPIQMRFFDMDSFGHVSNVAQQMYFDQGKTDLFRELWSRTEILARVPAVTVSVKPISSARYDSATRYAW